MEYYNIFNQSQIGTLEVKRRTRLYPHLKRFFDLIVAIILLILLAPLFLVLSVLILIDSPGPVLFRQTRVGKNRKPFTIFKFRSMHRDINRNGHKAFLKAFVNGQVGQGTNGKGVYKPIEKNQVTRVGRFLRQTSLDELPQLFNILKGDMSFIGPRPNMPAEVEAYKDWHMRRLDVLPGITGLAQINGRSSILFDQIARYDVEYVENEGLLMDLRILWQTVPLVLRGKGAE